MKDDCNPNSHYLTYAFSLLKNVGRIVIFELRSERVKVAVPFGQGPRLTSKY